jgi:hypothetical protein
MSVISKSSGGKISHPMAEKSIKEMFSYDLFIYGVYCRNSYSIKAGFMNQTYKIFYAMIILLFFLVLFACSGSHGPQEINSKVYNLGKASEFDMYQTIPRLMRKYQYDVLHDYDTGAYQSIDTEWKMRYPMDDEEEVGITEGKTRLFFRIRKTMDQLYYVRMEVQNMVKTSDTRDWFHAPMSKDVEREITRMADELKREFDEGRLTR